jgi:phosphatidylethanolamine/phosphatidyl-N-methylethanolamine N-methyltransferase
MRKFFSEHGLFLQEFWRHYHTTGAILPSGRWLARSLSRFVAEGAGGKRILEVGPGTGAVTCQIVRLLKPDDHFDLVELNEAFVAGLRKRFDTELDFQAVASRSQIHHCAVEQLPSEPQYDVIISGLPLNNFSPQLVAQILGSLCGLLKPNGTLSFFEYIGIRAMKSLVSVRAGRERLRGISEAMNGVLRPSEFRRDWVWPNVPPAWVHHVRPSCSCCAGHV